MTYTYVNYFSDDDSLLAGAPTGVAVGDVMLCMVFGAASSSTYCTATPPAGWTEVFQGYSDSNDGSSQELRYLGVWMRRYTGTETDWQWVGPSTSQTQLVLKNVALRDAGRPPEIVSNVARDPSTDGSAMVTSGTPTAPTLTRSGTGVCLLVRIGEHSGAQLSTANGWTAVVSLTTGGSGYFVDGAVALTDDTQPAGTLPVPTWASPSAGMMYVTFGLSSIVVGGLTRGVPTGSYPGLRRSTRS